MKLPTDHEIFVNNIPNLVSVNRLRNILFNHLEGYFRIEKSLSQAKEENCFSIRLKLSNRFDKEYLLSLNLCLEGFSISFSEYISKKQRLRKDASILGRKFHLSNLPPNSCKEQMRNDLESLGIIEEFYSKFSRDGLFLYAFVTFKNKSIADLFKKEGSALLPPRWNNISVNLYNPQKVIAKSIKNKIKNRRIYLNSRSLNKSFQQKKEKYHYQYNKMTLYDQFSTYTYEDPNRKNSSIVSQKLPNQKDEFYFQQVREIKNQAQMRDEISRLNLYYEQEFPSSQQRELPIRIPKKMRKRSVFSFSSQSNKNIRDVVRFGLNHHLDNLHLSLQFNKSSSI